MAPKGRLVSAKAKARAARKQKNAKRGARRAALALLNGLAEKVGAAAAQVDVRTASGPDVEFAIHVGRSAAGRCGPQRAPFQRSTR